MKNYFLEGVKEGVPKGYEKLYLYQLFHAYVVDELKNSNKGTDTETIERIKGYGLQLDEALEFIKDK